MVQGFFSWLRRVGVGCIFLLWGAAWAVGSETQDIEQQRRWFAAAERALENGDRNRFESMLTRLGDYPLKPYLRYRDYLDHPEDVEAVGEFLRRFADTRYARPLRIRLLKFLAAQARWRDYLRFYQELENTELQCHYGKALYELGNRGDAWRTARRLWLVGRSQPKACDPLFEAWRGAGQLQPKLVWRRFNLALDNDKPRLARYLIRFLPEAQRDRAKRWLEGTRRPQGLLCGDWSEFSKRDGPLIVRAIKRLARTDLEAAIALWNRHQASDRLSRRQHALGLRHIGLRLAWRHDPRAWAWLTQIPDTFSDETVRTWRVRAALRNQDWPKVTQAIARLLADERSQDQWLYWQARALAALRGDDVARPLLEKVARQADFYGFLAADRVQRAYAIDHHPVDVSAETMERFSENRTVRAIVEFSALDRYWDARREWWYLLNHADRQQLLATAVLARRLGWSQMAIFALGRAEHWDDLEIRFPLRFLDQVRKYASVRELNPAYIYGIIRQESAFDDHAASPAGARGLMQLMPYTARRVAQRLHERWRSSRVLLNADTNVRYGTAYFKSVLERFDNHFVLATAAYNAGPHRVERWLPRSEADADIWVETIPFRETRGYVRRVLSYAMIYQQRLGSVTRRLEEYARPVPVGEGASKKSPIKLACTRSG
ncbi:MAG: transglycosylase SLT domain-containing protein [Methylohalobius sp. ZOD2]